jgi:ABC-type transport system involved in multi-copper enzyme maturation permease subunit
MENRSWLKQAWTIAKIEMRRAFFSKRAFWVYGLALLPAVIFLAHGIQLKVRRQSLSATVIAQPALLDGIREGETPDAVIQRVGKPSSDRQWERHRRVSASGKDRGITIHKIEPAVEARYVRLNVRAPSYGGDPAARIYEFEVYGNNDSVNMALNRPATGSAPCSPSEGPEKAFNGSVTGGMADRWCSREFPKYLQVDLGTAATIKRVVIKHASAGGEKEDLDTAFFDIQASMDSTRFITIVSRAGARFIDEIKVLRTISYFDGRREATLDFEEGKLVSKKINIFMDFEEDRRIFAGVFQFFYLPLAIFFGCLGIFMNLFRGEMLDKTLHFWFLAPARREVLLIGKYAAGLIASTVIFAGGTLLCFGVMLQTHSSAEVQAYWHAAGLAHAFWYTLTAVMGCIGYGSVFLAAGMLLRNPIIPAAVLLAWEGINGFLPELMQKLSVLYYLQCLCPVPAPTDESMPALLKLLLSPAAPISRVGAVFGLLAVTALVLWIACIAIRRMEVSYSDS